MALPDIGGTFPPAPFDIAYAEHDVHDAWYVGDPARLESHYANGGSMRRTYTKGGLRGILQRFFWGRPNLQSNNRLHVPAPADVARTSSDLLFAQAPKFEVPEEFSGNRTKIQRRLDDLFNDDDTASTLSESAEVCSALGGTYLRLHWDEALGRRVMLDTVSCDSAIPTWRYKQLVGVTFWTKVLDDNGYVLRHLERHEPGRILHALYLGEAGSLGRRVPLTESEATSWAAPLVDAEGGISTGIRRMTAGYVPNVRPNRRWRTTPGLSQLGRSDFDGLEPLFDALDETYTSWMRDVDLGKGRIVVDEGLLLPSQRGQGGAFDSEQSVFTPMAEQLGSGADSAPPLIQPIQFAIRWQEHSQTCAEILNAILRGAGLSSNNFSDSSLTVGVQTATEVNSKDRLSERTRNKKIAYWKSTLRPLISAALQIDDDLFKTGVSLGEELPDLTFPTRSSTSTLELAQSISALRAANSMSITQSIIEQHPNWSKDEIEAERQAIEEQMQALQLPDPFAIGAEGGTDYDDDPDEDESPIAA